MTCWEELAGVPEVLTKGNKGNFKESLQAREYQESSLKSHERQAVDVSLNAAPKLTFNIQPAKKPEAACCMNSDKDDTCFEDDWQDFSESTTQPVDTEVFRTCFPLKQSAYLKINKYSCIFCEDRIFRHQEPSSLDGLICQTISSKFDQAIVKFSNEAHQDHKSKVHLNLDLPAECNGFDWNDPKESHKLDDMSPVVFKPAQPESPIGLDFDQGRAILGLAVLTENELKNMIDEMKTKFTFKSELFLKISHLETIQTLHHSNLTFNTPSKLESVGRALVSRKKVEDKPNFRFLSLKIPFEPALNLQWELKTLQDITEILIAIAEDSDIVPKLLADYIQYVLQGNKAESS